MDIIQEYLRTTKEFEKSYESLKRAVRHFNPYVDSLKLTSDKILAAFGVPLGHYFDLVVDESFTYMKIERR